MDHNSYRFVSNVFCLESIPGSLKAGGGRILFVDTIICFFFNPVTDYSPSNGLIKRLSFYRSNSVLLESKALSQICSNIYRVHMSNEENRLVITGETTRNFCDSLDT